MALFFATSRHTLTSALAECVWLRLAKEGARERVACSTPPPRQQHHHSTTVTIMAAPLLASAAHAVSDAEVRTLLTSLFQDERSAQTKTAPGATTAAAVAKPQQLLALHPRVDAVHPLVRNWRQRSRLRRAAARVCMLAAGWQPGRLAGWQAPAPPPNCGGTGRARQSHHRHTPMVQLKLHTFALHLDAAGRGPQRARAERCPATVSGPGTQCV